MAGGEVPRLDLVQLVKRRTALARIELQVALLHERSRLPVAPPEVVDSRIENGGRITFTAERSRRRSAVTARVGRFFRPAFDLNTLRIVDARDMASTISNHCAALVSASPAAARVVEGPGADPLLRAYYQHQRSGWWTGMKRFALVATAVAA